MNFTAEQKYEVKNNLQKILIYYGCKPGEFNWTCLPSRHKTPQNDLSVKNNICCCHCGLQGDSFNVIAELEGLDIKDDFPKILEKGVEIIGYTGIIPPKTNKKRNNPSMESLEKKIILNYDLTTIITNYFKKMKYKKYLYFVERNITATKLYSKYRIIVENPKKVIPKELLPRINNIYAYRYIIPVWENRKVVNCLLRRDDNLSTANKKIMNLKGPPLKIFNLGYIRHSIKNDIYFVTEGIFDCLSFENIGYKAIALNSWVMINRFLAAVKENVNQLKQNNVIFLSAFDNDKWGKEASKRIKEGMQQLELIYFNLTFNKYKDINDFYVKESHKFVNKINEVVKNIKVGEICE
jgi:DNA primase